MEPSYAISAGLRNTKLRYSRVGETRGAPYLGGMKLRLRQLREARGLTQAQLAELAGMSPSYYAEIEREVKTINGNRLESLARALQCSETDLFEARTEDETVLSMARRIHGLPEDQRRLVENLIAALQGGK